MVSAHRVELKTGEALFREGDAPTSAFLIESGRLRITATVGGQQAVLGDVDTGALVGEVAVLDDSPRTATATALEPTVLTAIDRNQFAERLAAADPVMRALLLSQFSRYRTALASFTGNSAPGVRMASSLHDAGHDKIRLEGQLREALETGGLEMRLQPIQHITTARISGYEALIRWHHPERGPISPAEFIALAEETSLIMPVGDYVLREVCAALRQISERTPGRSPYIGLNVSGRQINDPGFIDRVAAQVSEHGIKPAQLKIEITESLMLDYTKVSAFLERCHDAGMQVALDQAFVQQLGDTRCLAIVRAVIEMAAALRCDIVAEGVETAEQLGCLRDLGCQYAQGYLIGRAQSVESVLATCCD